MVIQSGLHLAHDLAETENDAEFVRFDPEEAGETPERDRRQREHRETLAAEIAARQHAAQFVLAAAQDFLEIRRLRSTRRLRSGALSLIHISEPTRRTPISYAVFCLKKK